MSQENNELFRNKMELMRSKLERGEQILPSDRIRVAVLADSPTVVTGFGNVCREVVRALHETGFYSFEIVGINYDGSPHDFPYRIWPAFSSLIPDPAYRDIFGRQKFLDVVCGGDFDIVWVLQDSFIVGEGLGQKIAEANKMMPAHMKFHFVYYFPIDAVPKKEWIDRSAMLADTPVVYTRYGHGEVMKLYSVDEQSKLEEKDKEKNRASYEIMEKKLEILYHGCNTTDFFPIPEDDRKILRDRYWGPHKDKFVFMNVNRNQPRKDIFRTMQAFKILLDRRRAKGLDDVYLYLHCSIVDTGLHLIDMGKQIDLVEGNEYAFPDPHIFSANSGYPISELNKLYNAADAVVSTTLGEGWGLSLTEAMAVRKPVIAPDNTSIPEILGKVEGSRFAERGFIVKTGGVFVQHDDNSRVRPFTDAEDMADTMEWVMEHPDDVKPVVDRAYDWVREIDWNGEKIGGRWRDIFASAYERALMYRAVSIDEEVKKEIRDNGIDRNEKCPLCGIKFKNCRHGKD